MAGRSHWESWNHWVFLMEEEEEEEFVLMRMLWEVLAVVTRLPSLISL